MKMILLFFMLLKFAESYRDVDLVVEVVKEISKIHYFSCFIILNSGDEKLLFERLTKSIYSDGKFPMIVQISFEDYMGRAADFSRKPTRCMKIIDGSSETIKRKFAKLLMEVNISKDHDIWLLFLKETLGEEEYFESLKLRFDIKLIALVKNSKEFCSFKAPYRVANDFPLRIVDLGNWSKADGLNLETLEVASARKNLEGYTFKSGTLHSPPIIFVTYDPDKKMIVEGYFAEIWKELGTRLNFTIEYVYSVDGTYGIMNPNKTFSGLFGMLIRKEIDVIIVDLIINEERDKYVDFSVPLISFGNQIYFTKLGRRMDWGSFLRPFRTEVWWVILAWFVVLAAALGIFFYVGCFCNTENSLYRKDFSVFSSFLIIFRAFTNQGSDKIPQSFSSRAIFFSAYFAAAIILPFYSAALISYITVDIPVRPFKSLEGMLAAGTHKLTVLRASSHYFYFSAATDPLLKTVYKKLIKPLKESDLPFETKGGLEIVCRNSEIAFYAADVKAKAFVDEFLLKFNCKIMTLENPLSHNDFAISVQDQSPYLYMINLELKKMKCEGVLNKIERKIWFPRKEIIDTLVEAIDLGHVVQIHCLLLAGYFLSSLVLICEIYSARRKRKQIEETYEYHRVT